MLFDFGDVPFRATNEDGPPVTAISTPVDEDERSSNSSCWNLVTVVLMVIVGYMLFLLCTNPATVNFSDNCSGMKAKTNNNLEHIEDKSDLEKILKEHPIVIIMFYANWCGHCTKLKPMYEEAATKSNKKFVMVNDKQRDLMTEHKIKGFPTVLKFKNGASSEEFSGARTVNALVDFANK